MATQTHALFTAEQFYQLPEEEGREFELLDGEVIEMPGATYLHNLIVGRLIVCLDPALNGRGEAVPNTDFSDGRYTTLQPDLAILLGKKVDELDRYKLPVTVPPDITVEVISPSESAFRVDRKMNAYLRLGTQEVWIIYPETRSLYIHTEAAIKRFRSGDAVQSPLLPDWSMPVDQLFE